MSRDWKLAWVLSGVLLAFIAGSAVRELTQWKEAGVGAAVGLPTLIALFGMFWVASDWKDALTASFVVAYFILLAGVVSLSYLEGRPIALEGGAKVIVENFSGLVGVVMAAYFGEKAVERLALAYQTSKVAEAEARTSEAKESGSTAAR